MLKTYIIRRSNFDIKVEFNEGVSDLVKLMPRGLQSRGHLQQL